jgi:hypothetical protein
MVVASDRSMASTKVKIITVGDMYD